MMKLLKNQFITYLWPPHKPFALRTGSTGLNLELQPPGAFVFLLIQPATIKSSPSSWKVKFAPKATFSPLANERFSASDTSHLSNALESLEGWKWELCLTLWDKFSVSQWDPTSYFGVINNRLLICYNMKIWMLLWSLSCSVANGVREGAAHDSEYWIINQHVKGTSKQVWGEHLSPFK